MRLKNKIAIVTGAGSSGPGWGNGKACAVQFAREGAHIVAIDMSADAVSETEAIIKNEGGDCSVFQGDVTQSDFIDETINECIKELGKIDILHNNVGVVEPGGPVEIEEKNWDRLLDINVKSMYLMAKSVLPHMVKAGGGSIINISSIYGIVGAPSAGAYIASKGAVRLMTKSCAVDLADFNIRVNSVHPGVIDTPMTKDLLHADEETRKALLGPTLMNRPSTPDEVSKAVLFLASEASANITGQTLNVDGGMVKD